MKTLAEAAGLLGPGDPPPFEVVNPDGRAPLLLVCEHAGQHVPALLGDLGTTAEQMNDHIGWDIGAAAVARRLVDLLDAPAVLQPYSRLVIDCNRPPDVPDAMPEVSDGHRIPGNSGLSGGARRMRIAEIFEPFQAEIHRWLARPEIRATFSIHSFTPRMNAIDRPWDIGFLFRADQATSAYLRDRLLVGEPGLNIGMNQPYQIEDVSDWFVPQHGEKSGLPHSLIEIRNDHLRTEAGQDLWAGRLAEALRVFSEERLT